MPSAVKRTVCLSPIAATSVDHQLEWGHVKKHWWAEWQQILFYDKHFNLSHQNGCICVQQHCGEWHLVARIVQRHTNPTPGVMVWGATRYHSQSWLLQNKEPPTSGQYMMEILQPEVVQGHCSELSWCDIPVGCLVHCLDCSTGLPWIAETTLSVACSFSQYVPHQKHVEQGSPVAGPPGSFAQLGWWTMDLLWSSLAAPSPERHVEPLWSYAMLCICSCCCVWWLPPHFPHTYSKKCLYCTCKYDQLSLVPHVTCTLKFPQTVVYVRI